MPIPVPVTSITGLVLAGGRAMRMGGIDKGLQMLHGKPLVVHTLERLALQTDRLIISANRHRDIYAALGAPWRATVVADAGWPVESPMGTPSTPSSGSSPDFNGPLAGLFAGMRAAQTDWLLVMPCDSPYPLIDLGARFGEALSTQHADIATVRTINASGKTMLHPVFALLRTTLVEDLAQFLDAGERRIRAWYARHNVAEVLFTDERAFYNINSLQELARLERVPQR